MAARPPAERGDRSCRLTARRWWVTGGFQDRSRPEGTTFPDFEIYLGGSRAAPEVRAPQVCRAPLLREARDLAAAEQEAAEAARELVANGVPAAAVARPEERVEHDPDTAAWGLWPEVEHSAMGRVRVDGLPVHLSRTDWSIARGSPCLGEHNKRVFGELLGLALEEIDALRADGVI